MDFAKGVGVGMAAGTAVGMLLAPKKHSKKCMANKVLKAASDIVENLSHTMGV